MLDFICLIGLKGKSSLMIFDRHANLKYKYGSRDTTVSYTHLLNSPPGEIVVPVKMPVTRDKTERPHGALL